MKLVTFKHEFQPTTAHLITRGKSNHFNIRHGTRLSNGWEVSLGISDIMVHNELNGRNTSIELNGDYYLLLPIYRKGTRDSVVDGRGNKKFFIAKNYSADTQQVLLFLHLPPIDGVKFDIQGMATVVSSGLDVTPDADGDIITEAPIVLFDGNAVITISYVVNEEEIVKRIICVNGSLQYK